MGVPSPGGGVGRRVPGLPQLPLELGHAGLGHGRSCVRLLGRARQLGRLRAPPLVLAVARQYVLLLAHQVGDAHGLLRGVVVVRQPVRVRPLGLGVSPGQLPVLVGPPYLAVEARQLGIDAKRLEQRRGLVGVRPGHEARKVERELAHELV